MSLEDLKPDFTEVVDSVMNLFGEVMSREAIFAVVEHYGGNLNESIEAIMSMSNDQTSVDQQVVNSPHVSGPAIYPAIVINSENQTVSSNSNTMQATNAPKSYAGVSQSRGAIPKQPKPRMADTQKPVWTVQAQQIMNYHKNGSRTLIIMRGAPGSGKSFLAKQLLQEMCPGALFANHIMSTDDYFMVGGTYRHCKNRLPEAHYWNQNRAREAMLRGVSPVFIDNTNVEIWQTEPYVKDGVNNGYIIEVLEPNTPWAKKAHQLAKKNEHDVPIHAIRRMLETYQNGVSGLYLIRSLGLSYPGDKVPPVMRNFPPIVPFTGIQQVPPVSASSTNVQEFSEHNMFTRAAVKPSIVQEEQKYVENIASTSPSGSQNIICASEDSGKLIDITQNEKPTENPETKNDDVQQVAGNNLNLQLDDVEKLEQAWENGEAWNETTEAPSDIRDEPLSYVPQPPRNSKDNKTVNKDQDDKFLPSTAHYNDWSNISMFMPAWNDYEHTYSDGPQKIIVETASHGTSVESGDTDMKKNNYKVLSCVPRDINFYYLSSGETKIPEKRMLDKSSMTNEKDLIASATFRCKNEEKHFITFRKLFKNVSKVELRDIFDKCVGDVNWAVCIVLDGMENNQLRLINDGEISETEDIIDDEPCNCLAAYNVVPNVNTEPIVKAEPAATSLPRPEASPGPITSKVKKDKAVLESSIQLKRQIEKSVVISDQYYSDHHLKLRKIRRGELNDTEDSVQDTEIPHSGVPDSVTDATLSTPSDDESNSSDDHERTVNIQLGREFVSKLDEIFGRQDFYCPDDVTTSINMPVSLLNEINALWMESLLHQLEQRSQLTQAMIRQDEEFARQLALKEEQLAQAGREPAVPELKEIMDLELALSIYKKEITEEWRSNEPNDLAAKMTRDKLYNLFPDVQQDILSELLMAHDNNFQATVEVLLSSTGNHEILNQENGVAKFVAKKELERHEKALEEQKKALTVEEWPSLNEKIDMKTVQEYRVKARQHLAHRNLYYERAQQFYVSDKTHLANYFADLSKMHIERYDRANRMAATYLIQIHDGNKKDDATLDLHYFQVPEACERLDVFLDENIYRMRIMQKRREGTKFQILYIITGRGLHSLNGPRIKPAVSRRLKERGLGMRLVNDGLLRTKVYASSLMTNQLP